VSGSRSASLHGAADRLALHERMERDLIVSRRHILGALLAAALASPAVAHTLDDVEQDLLSKEKYFQPVDKEAPGFTLQDADGRVVSLTDFRGKVVVLHFIYTNCPDSCPLHAEKIAEIQKMVNITPMKTEAEFISITTDPRRDRGQVLRDFAGNHGLDPSNWIFLTTAPGEPEDLTRELAKSYGVEFKVAENGEQMHGVLTNIIDQKGSLRGRFHGLEFSNLNLVIFVNALINITAEGHDGPVPGFWDWFKEWF
jgi:protein SCO1/2